MNFKQGIIEKFASASPHPLPHKKRCLQARKSYGKISLSVSNNTTQVKHLASKLPRGHWKTFWLHSHRPTHPWTLLTDNFITCRLTWLQAYCKKRKAKALENNENILKSLPGSLPPPEHFIPTTTLLLMTTITTVIVSEEYTSANVLISFSFSTSSPHEHNRLTIPVCVHYNDPSHIVGDISINHRTVKIKSLPPTTDLWT